MQITLVRHAQTEWNRDNRWQGQTDVPLSEHGAHEARELSQSLDGQSFHHVICSDLSRARKTLELGGGERFGTVDYRASWREMNLGGWCGLKNDEVRARFPDELESLMRGDNVRFGGTGESAFEFRDRVVAALRELETEQERDILLMTHGGVIRAVLQHILGTPPQARFIGALNTSMTRVVFRRGRWHLSTFNEHKDHGVLPAPRFAHNKNDEQTRIFDGKEDSHSIVQEIEKRIEAREGSLLAPTSIPGRTVLTRAGSHYALRMHGVPLQIEARDAG